MVHRYPPPIAVLAILHMGIAAMVVLHLMDHYWQSHAIQYVVLAFLIAVFSGLQVFALPRANTQHQTPAARRLLITIRLLCILAIPVFLSNAVVIAIFFLATLPLNVVVSGRLKQLPSVLFVIMVASAGVVLLDLVLPLENWRVAAETQHLWILAGIGIFLYLCCVCFIAYWYNKQIQKEKRLKINVATQYALVFTGISATVILLVTGVMIHQIRNAQIDQVGKSFQTIAENFAKLVGSHLEQQTQKMQMLTQQVPLFKETLTAANAQYVSRSAAAEFLVQKNRLWEGPHKDDTFIMRYLNNTVIKTLSRFRGDNSFHNDLVLVDGYGGLVASLGRKPERFYFYDQNWWKISWNGGLGNIFIGDLSYDQRTKVPKLRIAVDIIDRSTNEVIGMLASSYLLRTLLEDIQRFRPDTVDQISLTDAHGRVIAGTVADITGEPIWSQLSQINRGESISKSGWIMGDDHLDQAALIGYSTLSTAYNVISDPLHRLGWHIVVSGTHSNALSGVTRSTQLAMLVGLVAMALGVLGAIAAARVITRPIEDLTATASAMSGGELHHRASVTGPEELVALSVGFNRLTDQLHSVIRNLKSQTKQLAKAKQTAEEATQLKGQFLANMSHEIRTPLNAILGFADILESSLEDTKLKNHAQTIKSSGADLLYLINDILDLSKIEAGRMDLQIGPFHLRSLFHEMQRIFSLGAREKPIQIQMDVAPELPSYLMLDRARLRQVLFNLIGNAVKFTDEGWVRFYAKGEPVGSDGRWTLEISVQDTGIGIDPKVHAEIFDTFKQHHDEDHATQDGTGLGLAISKSLIEMMGGHIDVHSRSGKGTTFTIILEGVATADDAAEPARDIEGGPEKEKVAFDPAAILVADDLEVNRHLIVEALKPFPLHIDQAENGKDAVALTMKKRFDLILMDIRMPEMDGYDALKYIRDHLDGAVPVIIATTAAGMVEDIAKIKKTGFDDYLIRPFGQDALIDLLRHHLPQAYDTIASDPANVHASSGPIHGLPETAPWTCPPEAEHLLLNTLQRQWEHACHKQSIPDIIAFANDVGSVGEQYCIEVLSEYGEALAEFAHGYDIYHMEKLLQNYAAILKSRVKNNG